MYIYMYIYTPSSMGISKFPTNPVRPWGDWQLGWCFQSFAFQSGIDTPQLTVIFLRWMDTPQPDNPKLVFRLQVFTFRCVWDAHLD